MWTAGELKNALHTENVYFEGTCSGLSIDSRTVSEGDLFIALKGEQYDGHDYVREALKKGARAALVSTLQADCPFAQQVLVPSPLQALEQLAHDARHRTSAQVCAVTGSAGKTTVKEFLAHVLKHFGETVASKASYNNQLGVPYSLAQLQSSTHYGVFEVGMNHPGEIYPLAQQISPHTGIITMIGESHVGYMGSMDAIVEEKSEILRALDGNSTAIVPFDTPYYDRICKKAASFGVSQLKTFGKKQGADAQLLSFIPEKTGEGSTVEASVDGHHYTYTLSIPGEHSALNSLIVLLACQAFGVAVEDALPYVSTFSSVPGRGLRHILAYKSGYITLIDDAYNANPSSMRAGLSVLAMIQPREKGRRIAVLGDMKELGPDSEDYHRALALMIEDLEIDLVFASGVEMLHLYNVLSPKKRGGYGETVEGLISRLRQSLSPNDVVFVKGSKGSGISKVVDPFLKNT